MRSKRRWLALLTLVAVALVIAHCALYFDTELIDDAYISFRYADNLVAGHGLVFNPGDRVEGYTNFLWVLLLALARKAGGNFELVSRVAGAAFAAATVVATARLTTSVASATRPSWRFAPLLLALDGAFALWAVHGLETAMFAFLVTAALVFDARWQEGRRDVWPSAAFYALAALTRPEGVLLFAGSLGFRLWSDVKRAVGPRGLARLAVFAAPVAAHLVWRRAYYGDWLPNTFYAKVGGGEAVLERGLDYAAGFFGGAGGLLFLWLLPAAWIAVTRRRGGVPFLLWMGAVWTAIVVAEGGDAFPGYRFFVPVVAVFYVLVDVGFTAVVGWLRGVGKGLRPAAAVLLVAVVILHGLQTRGEARVEAAGANTFTTKMKLVAATLAETFPPGTTIALNPAGVIPFVTGFRSYDMLGLTDRVIARTSAVDLGDRPAGHERGNGAYILDRRPELILAGNVLVLERRPERLHFPSAHRSEEELFASPRLEQLYAAQLLPLADGRILALLRRRDTIPPSERPPAPR